MFFVGVFCLLAGTLGSCTPATDDDFDQQEEIRVVARPDGEVKSEVRRTEIRKETEAYFMLSATKMTEHFSQVLTPQSGKAFSYRLDYSQLFESRVEGYYAIRTTLVWEGRDLARLIDYNTCRVAGWLYYYPDTRKVYFIYDNRNSHVVKITSTQKWSVLAKGVTINF